MSLNRPVKKGCEAKFWKIDMNNFESNPVKSPARKFILFLLLIPLYLLSSVAYDYLEAGTVQSGLARAGSGLGALGILFFLPGVFFPFLLFPRKTIPFLEYLSWSLGLNWLFLLIITSAIKIPGSAITRTNLLMLIIPVSIIASLLAGRRRTLSVTPPPKKLIPLWGAVMLIILILGGICFRPFLVTEEGFWPIEYHRILDEVPFPTGKEFDGGIRTIQEINWQKNSSPLLKPRAGRAFLHLFNPGVKRRPYPLLFLFDAREEMQVKIAFNGRDLGRRYLHPPYKLKLCPRNYPPAKEILSEEVNLLPGENIIEFEFCSGGGKKIAGKPAISVWNFSGFDRDKFLDYFNSQYLIADTGDLREQLNLARNLTRRILPFTYSYDGIFFDGGGYTIEHPPFPFILKMLMLVLWENNLRSFQLLFWGLLAFLLLLLLSITAENSGGRMLIPAIFLGTVCVLSLFLIPYRIDTPYIAPTLSLVAIFSFHHLQRRQTTLFFLWALFTILSKGGIMFIGVGIVAFAFVYKEWRYPAKLIICCTLLAFITLGPTFFATWRDATPLQWKVLISGNYGERFAPLRDIFTGKAQAVRLLGQSALRYLLLVNVGSGFLALAWLLKKKSQDTFFILAAFFSFLAIAISKPSLISGEYSGHRLSYLAPVNFLIAIPAVSALAAYIGARRKTLLVSMLILSLLAFLFIPPILRSHRTAMASIPREAAHRAAVIDFLLRRNGDNHELIRESLIRFRSSLGKESRQLCYRLGRGLEAAGLTKEANLLFQTADDLKNKDK